MPLRLPVHHHNRISDATKLAEEFPKLVIIATRRQAAHEDLHHIESLVLVV